MPETGMSCPFGSDKHQYDEDCWNVKETCFQARIGELEALMREWRKLVTAHSDIAWIACVPTRSLIERTDAAIAEKPDARYGKRIPPFRNRAGELCGTCDGTEAHEHSCVECSRCGQQGLEENWPFDCCVSATPPKEKPE